MNRDQDSVVTVPAPPPSPRKPLGVSRSSRGAIAAPSLPPSCQPVVDLIPLARGNDRRLAAVAIHALSLLGVEEAIPAVAPLARTVPTRIRLEAIEFLSHWPESDDAEEAVLEASHSDAARVRTAAAIALALSDDDRATERLTEIGLPRWFDKTKISSQLQPKEATWNPEHGALRSS